jgi:predicted Zn-dependent protease
MKNLEPPDLHYLEAARGWLGLDDPAEAEAELQQISLARRVHPDVLQVRWQIHARREQWPACLDLAKSLTQVEPERRFGWVHLAYSLHRLHRTDEAREILRYALDMFPANATMAYYLARYCCSLGDLAEGHEWLERSLELTSRSADRERLVQRAMNEPDLLPLRAALANLRRALAE